MEGQGSLYLGVDTSAGEIEIIGLQIPRQARELRPLLGYMPQSFSLYRDLSVLENLQAHAA